MDIPKFENKVEKIAWLHANKAELMELKKASLKFTDIATTPTSDKANKALFTDYKDDPTSGVIKRNIVANTYYWMDSHDDVHVGNTFKKSIDERSNKVFHLHDHKHEVTAKVGKFVAIKEQEVEWLDLGISKAGTTTTLIAESEIKSSYNKDVFTQYLDGEIDQHSVGMRYIKIDLALNDADYEEEYKTYNQYIDKIGNREEVEKQGYFWAVKEASLVEISAVLMGSNELTPTVQNIEPSKEDTQEENEPTKSLDWKEVISNF